MTSCKSVWLATTGPDSPDRARVATGTKRDRSGSHIITETRCASGIVCSSSSTMKVRRPRSSNIIAVIFERLSSRRERRAAPMTVWSPADAWAAASADTRRRISESPESVCAAATGVARRAAAAGAAAAEQRADQPRDTRALGLLRRRHAADRGDCLGARRGDLELCREAGDVEDALHVGAQAAQREAAAYRLQPLCEQHEHADAGAGDEVELREIADDLPA